MADELNTGAEQAVTGTPSDAGAVQATEQTVEGEPESGKGLPTAGVDKDTEFKRLQGEYTRATQELSAYRKVGKSPDEIAAAIRNYEQGQQIAEALQKLAGGNQPPQDELPPELRNNPILTDPEYAYAKQAMEHLAGQLVKPIQQQQQEQKMAEVMKQAETAAEQFAKANPELGLTGAQLIETCKKSHHSPFGQLEQAAIEAVGGLPQFLKLKNAAFLKAYQAQALEDRRTTGTVISPSAPVGTAPEAPTDWNEHRELMFERARANAAARRGG